MKNLVPNRIRASGYEKCIFIQVPGLLEARNAPGGSCVAAFAEFPAGHDTVQVLAIGVPALPDAIVEEGGEAAREPTTVGAIQIRHGTATATPIVDIDIPGMSTYADVAGIRNGLTRGVIVVGQRLVVLVTHPDHDLVFRVPIGWSIARVKEDIICCIVPGPRRRRGRLREPGVVPGTYGAELFGDRVHWRPGTPILTGNHGHKS
jgi:hypothetical protein